MIRIAILLALVSTASAETLGTNPVVVCPPGSYPGEIVGSDGLVERYVCSNGSTPKYGLQVWSPLVDPATPDPRSNSRNAVTNGASPYTGHGH